jgi:uncharacterized membrane protein YphA (DoxX/SURF4 family)
MHVFRSLVLDGSDRDSPPHAAAALALRLGVAFVFLRFGIQKSVDGHAWTILVPAAFTAPLTAATGVPDVAWLRLLGYVEVLVGLHVALGLWTRAAAGVAVIVLVGAVIAMGTSGIGTRDVGLLGAAAAIVIQGAGRYGLDARLRGGHAAPSEEPCPCS